MSDLYAIQRAIEERILKILSNPTGDDTAYDVQTYVNSLHTVIYMQKENQQNDQD